MHSAEVHRAVHDLRRCVGLSVWRLDHGAGATVLALDDVDGPAGRRTCDAAMLDAFQYADCGPGTDVVAGTPAGAPPGAPPGAPSGTAVVDGSDVGTMRRSWPMFAAAAESRGVRGAVAVPIRAGHRAARPDGLHGVVLLYLSGPAPVDAAMLDLAEAVGHDVLPDASEEQPAHEPLSWGSRSLRHRVRMGLAALLIEQRLDLPSGEGERRLVDASLRAGIGPAPFADAVITALE